MSRTEIRLVCKCAERRLLEQEALTPLLEQNDTVAVDDLCHAAAEKNSVLAGGYSEVHACHPRAVRALFEFAGQPLPDSVVLYNHRADPFPASVVNQQEEKKPAWYPVIDYSRCTACGQCHDFCLFGVYSRDEQGRVVVSHPGNCKNNCPACARICPETAIIFPKVGEAPINGAEVKDENGRRAAVQVNVDEILGDDVYAALNARREKRRALLNRKKIEQALEERRRCSGGEG